MRVRNLARGLIAATLSSLPLGATSTQPYDWDLPDWAPRPVVPADNPMSPAKVELGRYLFYDRKLSVNQRMACASCHQANRGFTDNLPVAEGVTGERGNRSAMSLTNIAYLPTLTWANPNLNSLEKQALVPIFGEHPVEMGMAGKEDLLLGRLRADPRYPPMFRKAFPETNGDISISTVVKAIAAFERTLLSFNSPYDRYKYQGDINAISAAAKRGEKLFFSERMECYHCHGGFNFTDNIQHARLAQPELGFHNTGLYVENTAGDYPANHHGLREFTGLADDEGKFRTPTLRNIALTAPYMHDGSIPTLAAVITQHYARKGHGSRQGYGPNPLRSPFIEGFTLSRQEVTDLVAFMQSLTDEKFISNPKLADPFPHNNKLVPAEHEGAKDPNDNQPN